MKKSLTLANMFFALTIFTANAAAETVITNTTVSPDTTTQLKTNPVLTTDTNAQFQTNPKMNNQPAPNDATLAANVNARLADDSTLRTSNIQASAQGGVVTLNGTVTTQTEADNAVKIVQSVSGVSGVQSNIKVQAQP